ncbi:unnamed protein product [Knipowitschia caucasica]|uniref:EF-hand domain-containing protein n=1 Tax=Knipowitschia caucasica TaxID=637954 RepID=A0AAV2LNJ2_KNICA
MAARWQNTDFHKKIKTAFKAFDTKGNNTVDHREIGTIMFSLGCFPSQAEVHDVIAQVEEDDTSAYISLEKFLPVMTKVLLEKKFPPTQEDKLLQAFEVLDKKKKGYLEKEELTKYMMQEGEAFTQKEMDEMLTAFTDQTNNVIHYKDLIDQHIFDSDL